MIQNTTKTKFLIIATFKSNKTTSEVESWLKEVIPAVPPAKSVGRSGVDIIVAPSFPHLSLIASPLISCAQDVSPFPPGSYTGAVNATQLKDLGVSYCIIGHSERRRHFHETHADIAAKARELVGVGITSVICLSKDDVKPQLSALDDSDIAKSVFVYEPPADIGGTETAPLDDIKATCSLISSLTSRPVLYGGSVNAGNLDDLLTLELDGVLVSTASLSASSFIDLLNRYATLRT